jgi:glycosyltransferase involved in cell wall biosynthesis
MNTANVSVVIPAYQAEQTIARAIDSVLAQTVRPREIIVVDDGSPKPLVEQWAGNSETVRVLRIANSKTARARNVGLDSCQGDFVAFLDADDYWAPDKLERQLALFERYPQLGTVAGRFEIQALNGQRSLSRATWGWYDRVLEVSGAEAFLVATLMWTGTILVRRSTLAHERFVSGLEPAEDRDLWVRLAVRGPVYLMSTPLATAVMESSGISRGSIATDCTKMLEVVDRHARLLGRHARRRWRAYVFYRWAANEPVSSQALTCMLRSFACWPTPLAGLPAMEKCGRLKRMVTILRRLQFGAKSTRITEGAI